MYAGTFGTLPPLRGPPAARSAEGELGFRVLACARLLVDDVAGEVTRGV
jgi:hypothetical protein